MKTNMKTRQKGATLVVALLMLLVLTVLGLASMQVTRLEERMAGNSRDVNLAFQGAEAGLRDAEERIRTYTEATVPVSCAAAPCTVWQINVLPQDLRDQTSAWWVSNATEYGVAGTQELTEVTRDPLVVVEDLDFVADSLTGPTAYSCKPGRNFYRVTSDSNGASNTAEVVLESTFVQRYC
ncbi:MAG TPA: PilX N-terminal domain-containing pilus assembly protein [Steroidobacteraceae bacterium]|nr:PilX N-terminal domain-containing pilus assembly protein [Steroidobacteraceae bacterium]